MEKITLTKEQWLQLILFCEQDERENGTIVSSYLHYTFKKLHIFLLNHNINNTTIENISKNYEKTSVSDLKSLNHPIFNDLLSNEFELPNCFYFPMLFAFSPYFFEHEKKSKKYFENIIGKDNLIILLEKNLDFAHNDNVFYWWFELNEKNKKNITKEQATNIFNHLIKLSSFDILTSSNTKFNFIKKLLFVASINNEHLPYLYNFIKKNSNDGVFYKKSLKLLEEHNLDINNISIEPKSINKSTYQIHYSLSINSIILEFKELSKQQLSDALKSIYFFLYKNKDYNARKSFSNTYIIFETSTIDEISFIDQKLKENEKHFLNVIPLLAQSLEVASSNTNEIITKFLIKTNLENKITNNISNHDTISIKNKI